MFVKNLISLAFLLATNVAFSSAIDSDRAVRRSLANGNKASGGKSTKSVFTQEFFVKDGWLDSSAAAAQPAGCVTSQTPGCNIFIQELPVYDSDDLSKEVGFFAAILTVINPATTSTQVLGSLVLNDATNSKITFAGYATSDFKAGDIPVTGGSGSKYSSVIGGSLVFINDDNTPGQTNDKVELTLVTL